MSPLGISLTDLAGPFSDFLFDKRAEKMIASVMKYHFVSDKLYYESELLRAHKPFSLRSDLGTSDAKDLCNFLVGGSPYPVDGLRAFTIPCVPYSAIVRHCHIACAAKIAT